MNNDEARRLAEEHWAFLERWLHMVYVDAFIHGAKHEYEYLKNIVEERAIDE